MRGWQLAQVGLRLVRFQLLPHRLAAERLVVGRKRARRSAGGGGVGVPTTRRSTQSPRLTGLVRSGADVAVSTAPSRSTPPRLKLVRAFDQLDVLADSIFCVDPVDASASV